MKMRGRVSCWVLGLPGLAGAATPTPTLQVVRGHEDYPPFELHQRGRLTGLHVELVDAVAHGLGLRVHWQSLPWKRALYLVETGQADAITYIARTPEREAWAVFEPANVLSSAELRFIALKARAPALRFDGTLAPFLAAHPPIVVRGFQFGVPELDGLKMSRANHMADLVRMLEAGYSDVAVVNWTDFEGAFAGKPEHAAVRPLDPPIRRMQSFIAFSRAAQQGEMAQRFAKGMDAFKAGAAYAALLKKYGLARTPP